MVRRISNAVGLLGIGASVVWISRSATPESFAGLAGAVLGFTATLIPAPPKSRRKIHRLSGREGTVLVWITGLFLLELLLSNVLKIGIVLTNSQTFILLCVIPALFLLALLLAHRATASNNTREGLPVEYTNRSATNHQPATEAILRRLNTRIIEGAHEIRLFRRTILKEAEDILEQQGFFPLIDLEIENVGGEPARIHSLGLTVTEVSRTRQEIKGGGAIFDVSWDFTALLEPKEIGKRRQIDISATVLPSQTCRIVLAIGHQLGYGHHETIAYATTLDLRYDSDRVVELGKERIPVFCPLDFLPGDPSAPRILYGSRQVR